jgi:DNA-binding beta-propeller fold protein YncE
MNKFIFFLFLAFTMNFGNISAQTPTPTPTFCYSTQWGTAGTGNGQFNSVAGVGTDGTYVYVEDYLNNRIQKFSSTGAYLSKWGSAGTGNGQFEGPNGLAVANSKVYVAESGNNRVQVFDTNGNFQLAFGSAGSGNGQFNTPTGIASDLNGNIYVADGTNNRIQKFTSTGTYLTQWGSSAVSPGSGNGQFNWPDAVAVDPTGQYVYVADDHNQRVQEFSPAGTYLAQWGSAGSGNGQFNEPRGIIVDGAGNVYVSEFNGNRVQVFTATGTYLTQFGASGTGQLQNPQGIWVDATGDVYVGNWYQDYIVEFSLCSATLSSSVTPTPTSSFSGSSPPAQGQCFIYPSPARGSQATLSYYMAGAGNVDLKVWNEKAELTAQVTDQKPGGAQTTPFSISGFASGVYFYALTLQYDSGQVQKIGPQKFVILH